MSFVMHVVQSNLRELALHVLHALFSHPHTASLCTLAAGYNEAPLLMFAMLQLFASLPEPVRARAVVSVVCVAFDLVSLCVALCDLLCPCVCLCVHVRACTAARHSFESHFRSGPHERVTRHTARRRQHDARALAVAVTDRSITTITTI